MAAGFQIEQYAMMRHILDSLQSHHIKILICTRELLQMPQALAVQQAETDWERPRDSGAGGGDWGSQRAILFSGLSIATQVRDGGLNFGRVLCV
jgi:hypothetical protein